METGSVQPFSVIRLDAEAQPPNEPRRQILDAQPYTTDRARGWLDPRHLATVQVNGAKAVGSTQVRRATYRIDLPEHTLYRTTLVLGNPTNEGRKIHVEIAGGGGKHANAGRRLDLPEGKTVRGAGRQEIVGAVPIPLASA